MVDARSRDPRLTFDWVQVPVKTAMGATWDCAHHAMCRDSSKIMFAWAKHAQPTQLPEDVGFQLEEDDYIVLQVLPTATWTLLIQHTSSP